MKPLSTLLGVVTGAMVTTLGIGSAADAADFSFRGTFAQDDDVQLFDFSVLTESTVTLRTYSYAGGTQADGTVIAAGGFDPILTLFDANGDRITDNDDDPLRTITSDPVTGQVYDSLIELVLAAGNYKVALTQFDNFVNGNNLADGFNQTGNSNFTSEFSRCTTDSMFCDFTGNLRTNEWAFDALGVLPLLEPDAIPLLEPDEIPISEPDEIPTQVPEPTTTLAFALAGLGAIVQRRRKQ